VDRLELSARPLRWRGLLRGFCQARKNATLICRLGYAAAQPQILEFALQGFQLLDAPRDVPDVYVKQRVDAPAVLLWPISEAKQHAHLVERHV
jgi:hypothetical protein